MAVVLFLSCTPKGKTSPQRSPHDIGNAYLRGEGRIPSPQKALKYYMKGCDGGNPASCVAAGELFQKGRGTPKNLKLAKLFFSNACKKKDKKGL